MPGFPSPFGSDDGSGLFDAYDEFVPEHVPEPGPFLGNYDPLTGTHHAAFHRVTREIFEERTVYDVTFNYNLARLNIDTRHPDAGYRYAERADDPTVLHAEFTPTTPFCPQSHALTVGSFRAWNGLAERHEYDLVRVRVHPMHQDAERVNERLEELETEFRETGSVTHEPEESPEKGSDPTERAVQDEGTGRGPAGHTDRGIRADDEARLDALHVTAPPPTDAEHAPVRRVLRQDEFEPRGED